MTDWADEIAHSILIARLKDFDMGNEIASQLRKARADEKQEKGVLIYEKIMQGQDIPSWAYHGIDEIHGLVRVSIFRAFDPAGNEK